ncbi:MAG TPA: pyridoxamine 5'-phosphate oxidase family protein [Galbitalea sp.]|jgi:PPOX class probable F420-dependent enzyme|nr:pyridoxamine 5'-phosphate oxidase family protein [Galbitalea sp.]
MLDPTVRRIIDAAPIAHLATLLPDGSPHSIPLWVGIRDERIIFLTGPNSLKARNLRRDSRVALSIAPADNPFEPISIRGRVVEWISGDDGWKLIDQLAMKYIGSPYSKDSDRVIGVIEPEAQIVGVRL